MTEFSFFSSFAAFKETSQYVNLDFWSHFYLAEFATTMFSTSQKGR